MSTSLFCALTLGLLQPGAVEISAHMQGKALTVGETHSITFTWMVIDGVSVSEAGMPAPLIQIETPASVQLVGQVLETPKELSKNEFLRAPFERALESSSNAIEFKLLTEPSDGDQIAVNFIAYTKSGTKGSEFVRKRMVIPLAPSALGVETEIGDAAWSGNTFAKIGEKVKPLQLPRADGSEFDLNDWLGKTNIIITTYRAHW